MSDTRGIVGSLWVTVMQKQFHSKVQNFVVNGFGIAVVRNMAPKGKNKGYLDNIRQFLKKIDLEDFGKENPSQFPQMLDGLTEKLRRHMPTGARYWSTARKCLNLFFRDALYNFYLRKEYGLEKFERYMEIPLDSNVGKKLREEDKGLPRRDAVIRLTPEVSAQFQEMATRIAKREGIARAQGRPSDHCR
jgi:hypothetical protein